MIMNAQFDLGGVVVATTLAFKEDSSAPAGLAVDYDKFAAHCDFLINNGCRGVGPNGSLGEYSSLTDAERRKVVQVAVETVAGRGLVVAGVHGVGWHQAKQWAEYAEGGRRRRVLLLPPTIYRANRREIIEHYTRVNEVGLPIMLYNNPFDTKVDLTPDLVAELYQLENVVAVKEFSGRHPPGAGDQGTRDIDVIAGADDLLFESLVVGRDRLVRRLPQCVPEGGRRDLRPRHRPARSPTPASSTSNWSRCSAGIRERNSSRRSSSRSTSPARATAVRPARRAGRSAPSRPPWSSGTPARHWTSSPPGG